jgi:hypothetical protein
LPLLFDSNYPMEQQTILSFSENFTTEQWAQNMEAHKISPKTEVYSSLGKIRNNLWKPSKHVNDFLFFFFLIFFEFLRLPKTTLSVWSMDQNLSRNCCKNFSSIGASSENLCLFDGRYVTLCFPKAQKTATARKSVFLAVAAASTRQIGISKMMNQGSSMRCKGDQSGLPPIKGLHGESSHKAASMASQVMWCLDL